jgi:hypothetical protein
MKASHSRRLRLGHSTLLIRLIKYLDSSGLGRVHEERDLGEVAEVRDFKLGPFRAIRGWLVQEKDGPAGADSSKSGAKNDNKDAQVEEEEKEEENHEQEDAAEQGEEEEADAADPEVADFDEAANDAKDEKDVD